MSEKGLGLPIYEIKPIKNESIARLGLQEAFTHRNTPLNSGRPRTGRLPILVLPGSEYIITKITEYHSTEPFLFL